MSKALLPELFLPQNGLSAREFLAYKRWFYWHFVSSEQQLGLAWVDLGYICKVFVYAQQTQHGQTQRFNASRLFSDFSRRSLRQQGEQLQLQCLAPKLYLQAWLSDTQGQLSLSLNGLNFVGSWQAGPCEAVLVNQPLTPLLPYATRKQLALAAKWQLEWPGMPLSVQQGQLGWDISAGGLPRRTAWYWAFAQGPHSGFNLTQGFLGRSECVAWQPQPVPLSEPTFHCPTDPLQPWQLQLPEGELMFQPQGLYRDRTRLGLVKSDFVQVYGHYSGQLKLPEGPWKLNQLPGVAEFQDTLW